MNLENKKDSIIKELETMSKKETIEKNFFKVRAYIKVIDQLKTIEKINSMSDVKNVQGIGPKIKDKIEEILKTGKLKSAERARESSKLHIYDELLKIHGVGMVKAKELVEELNIKSIKELQRALETDPGILNKKQKNGLKYYLDLDLKIPRKEMDKHSKKIIKLTSDIDKDIEVKIVGSYRRGSAESGDIDVLVTINRKTNSEKRSKILEKVISIFKEKKYLLVDLASGKKKYMGICRYTRNYPARRIDILMTSFEEYPFALLYFTGDFQINVAMRKRATELGYTLNEYGVRGKIKPELNSEKEIFDFLGYKYLKPNDRMIQNLKNID